MILYGMLYAVAVGLPILLAAWVTSSFLQRHGWAERGVWAAALLLALALPAVALTSSSSAPVAAPLPLADPGEGSVIALPAVVAVPGVRVAAVSVARGTLGVDQILLGVWLLASLALAVRWAVAAKRLARIVRSCPAATVDGVRVRLTADLGPAVAGWLRPRILLPSWLESLPPEQRSLVLLHEVEHVRARDPLLITASRLARILTPWNPFVWLISSRLRRAVELDCDRRVLRRRPDVRAYGTTLLTVSSRPPAALLGAAAFAEAEAPLRRRILAMTTPPGTVSILGLFTALVFGILLLLGAFGVPVPMLTDATSQASAASVSGTIVGTVRDENSDEPIEHVQVFLRDLAIGSLTDERGQYFLEHVPVGVHEVVAQRIGLGEMAREVDVADGTTVDVDFRLQQTAVELNPLLILETEPLVYVDGERVASLDVSGRVSPDEVERVEILKGDAAVPLYGEEARGGVVQVFTKQDAAPAPDEPREHPFDLPTFTPFSEPPRILNVDEVRAAMREAYPPELRADAIGGTVELWFYVTEEGRVGDYRIAAGSGHQALDDAALAVADVYRFSPALNRDERVPVWVTIPIAFLPSR